MQLRELCTWWLDERCPAASLVMDAETLIGHPPHLLRHRTQSLSDETDRIAGRAVDEAGRAEWRAPVMNGERSRVRGTVKRRLRRRGCGLSESRSSRPAMRE